ncbi:MAG: hypothetical protein K6C94_07600 [Candidatus Gastranaerophilales bacterium]|nr:hypothetical protein [Candidatus Gastranaerophilales bacterium]
MSLKSRLLKNRELKSLSSTQDCSDIDLIAYFKENRQIDKLNVYAYNKIFAEKNGTAIQVPVNFTTEEAYLDEINRIIQVNDGDLKEKRLVFNRKNDIITILMPPIIKNVPYLSIERKKDISYSDYFDDRLISSEIAAYFKEALSRKANIFIVGNADVEKSLVLNFLLDLTGENNKNLIYDNLGKIFVKRLCNINFSQNELENIKYTDYDNIFCSDVSSKDLTQILSLITSGYRGFAVSLSIREDIDTFAALRNLILLDNINLFEENADFLTSSAIDIIVFTEKDDREKVCITKVSEVIKNKQKNLVLKDIFVVNSVGTHVSTGNASKFYNQENTNSYLKEYLEDDHVHSYVSGYKSVKKQEPKDETAVTEKKSKKQKLKEKLKRLKQEMSGLKPLTAEENTLKIDEKTFVLPEAKEEIPKASVSAEINIPDFPVEEMAEVAENTVETESVFVPDEILPDDNEIYQEPPLATNEGLLSSDDDFAKEDIIDNTLYSQTKIRNIFDEADEPSEEIAEPEVEPEVIDAADVTEVSDYEMQEDLTKKYAETIEPQIIEEPELFSEITEEEVASAEDDYLSIDDEDI